jgi:hypothetical protein
LGAIARKYRTQNGGKLDEGVYDEYQKFADSHPLFKNMRPAGRGGGAEPDNNAIAAEMRRRGLLK